MGADLYIEGMFDENQKKYEVQFNEAVAIRNGLKVDDKVRKAITDAIAKHRGREIDWDEMPEIPEGLNVVDACKVPGKPVRKLNLESGEVHIYSYPVTEDDVRLYSEYAAAQAKVTEFYEKMYAVGYFRDSYNATSLFAQLGLSWWTSKFINDEGMMTPEKAGELLVKVEGKKLPELAETWPEMSNAKGTAKEWQEYFVTKKKSFEDFLRTAIKAGKSIRCSC